MRPWHTSYPPASRSSKGFNTGVLGKFLGHLPHLWPWLELEFKTLCHPFSFHSCSGWREVCFLLSTPHSSCYFSSPSGYLLLEISLQLLLSPHTWLYFSFKWLNVRGSAAEEFLFPRPVKSLIPSWISFSGNTAPRNMSRKLTNPTPMSFSGPTNPRMLRRGDLAE